MNAKNIIMIIDSLELNGGSSMFLEMVSGFRKYYPQYNIQPIVVSKTGQFGRNNLVRSDFQNSYKVDDIELMDYASIEKRALNIPPCTIVMHHRLGCTKSLHLDVPYIVINHTIEYPHRISEFKHATYIVSVCQHISNITKMYVNSLTILNGIENDYINDIKPAVLEGDFKTGRCHRLVPSKFSTKSLSKLEKMNIPQHIHYIAGTHLDNADIFSKFNGVKYVGPIFNRQEKISLIKSLNVYFYDTDIQEGASVSVLESLACGVPVLCRRGGGNDEIIIHGVNGFFFKTYENAKKILKSLSSNKYKEIQKTTVSDFNNRLHIKHMLRKYVKLIEKI